MLEGIIAVILMMFFGYVFYVGVTSTPNVPTPVEEEEEATMREEVTPTPKPIVFAPPVRQLLSIIKREFDTVSWAIEELDSYTLKDLIATDLDPDRLHDAGGVITDLPAIIIINYRIAGVSLYFRELDEGGIDYDYDYVYECKGFSKVEATELYHRLFDLKCKRRQFIAKLSQGKARAMLQVKFCEDLDSKLTYTKEEK